MKQFVVTLMCVLLACVPVFAQSQAKEEIPESKSKSLEFLKADGTFIVKEFYDLQ